MEDLGLFILFSFYREKPRLKEPVVTLHVRLSSPLGAIRASAERGQGVRALKAIAATAWGEGVELSCCFWLLPLARGRMTHGLALGWAGREYTGRPAQALFIQRLKAKLAVPCPCQGQVARCTRGWGVSAKSVLPWARGSFLREITVDDHCHL